MTKHRATEGSRRRIRKKAKAIVDQLRALHDDELVIVRSEVHEILIERERERQGRKELWDSLPRPVSVTILERSLPTY